MTTKPSAKLNTANHTYNTFIEYLDIFHRICIYPYQFLSDTWDGKRGRWRLPRGLERIELTRYGPIDPREKLRQHGIYSYMNVMYIRLVTLLTDTRKKEKRGVQCFYVRHRQSRKAHWCLRKYSQTKNGSLLWLYYGGGS